MQTTMTPSQKLKNITTGYHISRIECKASIEDQGLAAQPGWLGVKPTLFFIIDQNWTHTVASSLHISEFDLWSFPLSPLNKRKIHNDTMAEFYRELSFYYTEYVERQHVTYLGRFKYEFPKVYTIIDKDMNIGRPCDHWTPKQIAEQMRINKQLSMEYFSGAKKSSK